MSKAFYRNFFILLALCFLLAVCSFKFFLPEEWFTRALGSFLLAFLILVVGGFLIFQRQFRKIKNELFQILEPLKSFDVDQPEKVIFKPSPSSHFYEIQQHFLELIERIQIDYQANKQFTENASHELQTPLAVIKGHIEMLLQSPNIGEKEYESLAIVLQNTNRLAKLNSALILLSKIEHQRFVDTVSVDFGLVCGQVVENFQDLIAIRNLKIEVAQKEPLTVPMSATLAEILLANLVQNAIRHNLEGGKIDIKINKDKFSISNTGKILDTPPKNLFKRFKRESTVEESLGLGLSIVQRICEHSALQVSYVHHQGIHIVTIQPEKDRVDDLHTKSL